MSKTKIDIEIDAEGIAKAAYEKAMEQAKSSIQSQASRYFSDGRYGGIKGEGYKKLEAALDGLINSDETAQRIQGMIDKAWPAALDKAIEQRLFRAAGKAAHTKGKIPE